MAFKPAVRHFVALINLFEILLHFHRHVACEDSEVESLLC